MSVLYVLHSSSSWCGNLQLANRRPSSEQTPTLTTAMREKRKRKRRKDNTGSATAVTDSVDDGTVAETEAGRQSPESERQANGSISPSRPDTDSGSEYDFGMDSDNQREVSPDLSNMLLDPVLPGIEDPTSPAYRTTGKQEKHQRKRARAKTGDRLQQTNSFVPLNCGTEADPISPGGPAKARKRAPSKRKRPVQVNDSVDPDSSRPKKQKRIRADYKTAQLQKFSQGPLLNGSDAGPKEGPFTDAELAKLFAFRDQYCEENSCTQQQFNIQIHANAHNNVKNIGFWNQVSEVLPYRTRHALQRVCRRRFHNFAKRGTWTAEEDKELREAHEEHGNKWKIIGEQIERLPEDCRDRWRNYLKDSKFRNRQEWTTFEVDCLKDAVEDCMAAMREANRQQKKPKANARDSVGQQGGEDKDLINWVIVSERLGGSRSRLQCSWKWKQLIEKANEPDENRRRASKKYEWRRKEAEEKYPYMRPGDKYELLNA